MAAPMKLSAKVNSKSVGLFNKNARLSSFVMRWNSCQMCQSKNRNPVLKYERFINTRNNVVLSQFLTLSNYSNQCRLKPVQVNFFNTDTRLLQVSYPFRNNQARTCVSGTNEDKSKEVHDKQTVESRENIWTIPNLLTTSRILMTPCIGYLVVTQSFPFAMGLFLVAGITDMLDGYIARNVPNQMSNLGTALDPLADKILITVLTVTLTKASLLPLPLAVLIIGRDALLVAGGFVIRYLSLPQPRTLTRYFDVTIPTAKLMPTTLSKWNTFFQLGLVCSTLAGAAFSIPYDHVLFQSMWYLTGATTVGSAIDYAVHGKKCVKFLHSDK